jgi:predicted outer membrane repeat protein
MASVCASDTNDTAMATTDIMELPQNEKLLTDDLRITEGDSSLSQTNDNGTFSDLQSKINAAEEEGTINLMNDYTFNGSDKEISITKAITINGNGFTINALEKSRIFNIESSGHIVLNNITFINGKSDLGGAILFGNNVSDIVIDNCKFINNSATFNGGALYANATFINSTIANTEFGNNDATRNGGAIYFKGQSSGILFENLTFENNVAQYGDSGAINFYGKMSDITFDNVVFYNNSAKSMGSAPSMGGAINIDNCVENCLFNNTLFVQNFAKNSAGALSINKAISALTFENTNFINNTAELEDGGAIHVGTWSRSNLVGATFKNVVFAGNAANSGGALFVTGETSSNVFEDVKFIKNVAKKANGGAITLGANKNLNSTNNTF